MIIELNLLTYGMEAAAQKGATGLRSEPGVTGEVIRGAYPFVYGGNKHCFVNIMVTMREVVTQGKQDGGS